MNRTEHLLTCLAEEAAEVAQAATKALRFGLQDTNPRTGTTAEQHICAELNDLVAVAELLRERGALPHLDGTDNAQIGAKKAKVARYMAISEQRGTLS